MTALYFAYGSNLNLEQLKARCPSAKMIDRVWLHGERLVFRSYSPRWRGGVASIVTSRRQRVAGLVFEMSDDDMRALDGFEGHPGYYRRELVHVQAMKNLNRTYEAWTYRLPGGDINPPSHLYLAQIYLGYVQWRFNLRALPLASAIEQPRESARYRPPLDKALRRKRIERAAKKIKRKTVGTKKKKQRRRKRREPAAQTSFAGWSTKELAEALQHQIAVL